jgi:hypothetical protein
MAVILAWVLQVLLGNNATTLALSFIAGLLPNTVLRRIRDISVFDWAKQRVPSAFGASQPAPEDLDTQSPLTVLDEIDVYERTRLEEEGITCVQALARHDFVDLMLSSRIPVPRLVDWMDQAILFQHVPGQANALRALSIRNASDFLCYARAVRAGKDASLATALDAALGAVVSSMLEAELLQDEWLRHVLSWRAHDGTRGGPILVYDETGTARELARPADGTAPTMKQLRALTPFVTPVAVHDEAPVVMPDVATQLHPQPQGQPNGDGAVASKAAAAPPA